MIFTCSKVLRIIAVLRKVTFHSYDTICELTIMTVYRTHDKIPVDIDLVINICHYKITCAG